MVRQPGDRLKEILPETDDDDDGDDDADDADDDDADDDAADDDDDDWACTGTVDVLTCFPLFCLPGPVCPSSRKQGTP